MKDKTGARPCTMYAAIRRTEGREWIDIETLAHNAEVSAEHMRTIDQRLPQWAAVNKFRRIARVKLSEVVE